MAKLRKAWLGYGGMLIILVVTGKIGYSGFVLVHRNVLNNQNNEILTAARQGACGLVLDSDKKHTPGVLFQYDIIGCSRLFQASPSSISRQRDNQAKVIWNMKTVFYAPDNPVIVTVSRQRNGVWRAVSIQGRLQWPKYRL